MALLCRPACNGRTRWTGEWTDGRWRRGPACSPGRRPWECCQGPSRRAQRFRPPDQPSLYDRLGGFFPIAAVVDRFSDAIIVNPKLNENPALREWNATQAETRLPGLKFGRTLWMAAGQAARSSTPACRWTRRTPVSPHGGGVRRGRGGDRPRPRLLRGAAGRAAGARSRLQRQHARRGDGQRIARGQRGPSNRMGRAPWSRRAASGQAAVRWTSISW